MGLEFEHGQFAHAAADIGEKPAVRGGKDFGLFESDHAHPAAHTVGAVGASDRKDVLFVGHRQLVCVSG